MLLLHKGKEIESSYYSIQARKQLSWFIFYRILILSLFLGGTIIYQLRCELQHSQPPLPHLYMLVVVSYLQAILSAVILIRTKHLKFLAQCQIVWDLLLATFLIYVTGGIDSSFSFLYILIIIGASLFLDLKELILVASASSIFYGSILDLQYFKYLPSIGGLVFSQDIEGRSYFFTLFIHVIAFFSTAILSGFLTEQAHQSEQALEARNIDFEELENLNQTILDNIASGLMIINNEGRIRSFNAGASKITGYSFDYVYNRPVREIFPTLKIFDEKGFHNLNRREADFVNRNGDSLVLGYASTYVNNPQGKMPHMLVTFQDLTHLKDIEEQLKRADRLAAVGRLASGMAHEIRNPLASISGSVQLLMDNYNVSPEDLKLMKIVVKETERLGNLLTDFLVYARPASPKPSEVNISALINDIADIITKDPHFSAIEVQREYAHGIMMYLDMAQFRQALWNLVINGVEAMEGKGRIRLGINPVDKIVYVEDTGPGIPKDIRDKIFDPFFSTKEKGTGLGLALVYSIVENHGGVIEVTSENNKGTRFNIYLPNKFNKGNMKVEPCQKEDIIF
ncbi:MAG: two-component system sensor histidine kinase NtrB [bacterium]